MSSVDDRIVNMQFNSRDFKGNADSAKTSLDNVEKAMSNAAKNPGLAQMGQQTTGLKAKFSALQVAGVTALATITNKAVNAGLNMVKSFTINPIKDGFSEYNTTLKSTQTILANTGLTGEKGLRKVENALTALNTYSDQTIYNFGEMAKNIGTFSAAGVNLKDSVASIQGISNIAALSGSTSQQASSAMYQLSQALAAGRVNLQDWNSVVNAGMGGKQFQTALAQTGVAMGTISKNALQLGKDMKVAKISGKSFRESIAAKPGEQPWLTDKVLVQTLKVMDGRLSASSIAATKFNGVLTDPGVQKELDKQQKLLAKQGYTKEQIDSLTKMANAAYESATVVKTFPQLIEVTKEAIGSQFAKGFKTMIGGFNESKKLWTAANKVVGAQISTIGNAMNNMLTKFVELGGRSAIIETVKNTFKALGAIVVVVKSAFRDVFPPTAANTLANFAKNMQSFTAALIPGAKTMESMRKIFGGVFAVLHIGLTIVKAITGLFGGFFGELFKGVGKGSGGVLEFLGHIGELLINLDKFISKGNNVVDVFNNIGAGAGKMAGKAVELAANFIFGLVNGLVGGSAFASLKDAVTGIGDKMIEWIKGTLGIHSPSTVAKDIGTNVVDGLVLGIQGAIGAIFKIMNAVVLAVMDGFHSIFTGMDTLDFVAIMNALFSGALILTIRSFLNSIKDAANSFAGVFGGITDTLDQMQQTLKAQALMAIAIAIGILVAAVIAMQFIDAAKLGIGLGAIGALMGMMLGAFAVMSKIGKVTNEEGDTVETGSAKLVAMAGAMLVMANAMLILTAAVTILAHQDPKKVAIGIGFMTASLGVMIGAVFAFSKMSELAKGAAGAILVMSFAMNVLAAAILAFGLIPMDNLVRGIGAMAVALGLLVAAAFGMSLFGNQAKTGAVAILLMSGAMVLMAAAVAALGNMDVKSLAKGLGALTIVMGLLIGTLLILAPIALQVGVIASAIALMSAAVVGLAIAIGILGSMDGATLAQGLLGVALAFGILILAAAGAMLVAPGLEALALAVTGLGLGLALAGAGMFLFATGLAILIGVGTAGVALLAFAFQTFMGLLPSFAISIAAAFVAFIETIAKAAPRIRVAMSKIFEQMLGVVEDAIPKIGKLIQKLIDTAIKIIKKSVPQWVEMGFTIIDRFIKSAADHVPKMADNAMRLITTFLDKISARLPALAESAVNLILTYVESITAAINNNADRIGKAGLNMALALANGLSGGLLSRGLSIVKDAAMALADKLPGWMKKVLHIKSPSRVTHEIGVNVARGLANGIIDHTKVAVEAARGMANAVIAEGDKAVYEVQKRASAAQKAADAAKARADAQRKADAMRRKADPKWYKANKAAIEARQEKLDKLAEQAQGRADSASSAVDRAKQFAEADNQGKGDMKNEDAVRQAAAASRMLAKANAEAAQAAKLMKTNKAAGLALLKQAKADAAEAARIAKAAQASHAAALKYYAMEVNDRIKALEEERAADEKARADAAEFEAADAAGKQKILEDRAKANEDKAAKLNADAAKWIEDAKRLAATDAAAAMELLDKAEQATQEAQAAADQAKQERDQIDQLTGQSGVGGVGGTGGTIQPSRSMLEDAASSVDRYTASLQSAEELAGATAAPIQYVQNNYSPVALTASEVYRQTNNLLSAAELNMGVPPSTGS